MSIVLDDEDEGRPRVLSNLQVLAYIARHWMAEPVRFALACILIVTAAACDLAIPWASRALMDAVSGKTHLSHVAWMAWATLTCNVQCTIFTSSKQSIR